MSPTGKLQIPPIEPGTPAAVRQCYWCKAPIEFPAELLNGIFPHFKEFPAGYE